MFLVEAKTKTCPGKGKDLLHQKQSSQPPRGSCTLIMCSGSAECPALDRQRGNSQSYRSKNAKLQIASAQGMSKSCGGCALTPAFSFPHRPRILEMDKEENRRSVLLPKHRRRSNFSSENYWRRSYEYTEDCDEEEEDGSPARKVKMRRH